jgi:hypothetical protein
MARGDCADADRDEEMEGEEDEADKAEVAGEAAEVAEAVKASHAEADSSDTSAQTSKVLEEIRTFVQDVFFEELRRRILRYLDELQVQQQRERELGGSSSAAAIAEGLLASDSEDEAGDDDEREARRTERLRKHLEQKWSFPDIPGRRAPPASVDFEFMRAIIQILMLEECILDQVQALRDRMCQKLRVSSFQHGLGFESPCFPLILRDVTCQWCYVASHVDVMSHVTKGPGLWVCTHCNRNYDKDAMQARLVELLQNIVQAWQSQEIICIKCQGFRTAHIQNFCDCFGRFQVKFNAADFRLVLRVMRSLTGPHDLPWLNEMLDLNEPLLAL